MGLHFLASLPLEITLTKKLPSNPSSSQWPSTVALWIAEPRSSSSGEPCAETYFMKTPCGFQVAGGKGIFGHLCNLQN